MHYEGMFEYVDGSGYLDVLSLDMKVGSISFNIDSITHDLDPWNVQGMAQAESEGRYAAIGLRATQGGVSGPPVDLTFHLSEVSHAKILNVIGTWSDGDGIKHFAGMLEPVEQ